MSKLWDELDNNDIWWKAVREFRKKTGNLWAIPSFREILEMLRAEKRWEESDIIREILKKHGKRITSKKNGEVLVEDRF